MTPREHEKDGCGAHLLLRPHVRHVTMLLCPDTLLLLVDVHSSCRPIWRPVSFYLAEEAAQHQKGGKSPGQHIAIILLERPAASWVLSKLDAGRDPRRKTSLGGDSACSESNESNQSIATANSDASTCLPDDHIVQLQTELSKSGPHAVLLAVLLHAEGATLLRHAQGGVSHPHRHAWHFVIFNVAEAKVPAQQVQDRPAAV